MVDKAKRDNNIDSLRIIAMFFVIITHVMGPYFMHASVEGNIPVSLCIYETLTVCGVNTFFIISGAFMLSNDKYGSFGTFYSHITKVIVIPTLIFSVYYFLYASLPQLIKGDYQAALNELSETVQGRPYYHLWYLYALLSMYLFVPAIIRLRKMVEGPVFDRIAILVFISSTVSDMTSAHKFQYDPGSAYRYVGYLFMGYVIYKHRRSENNRRYLIAFILGFIVLTVGKYMIYSGTLFSTLGIWCLAVLEHVLPLLLFGLFSGLNIKVRFPLLVSLGFYMYLLHALIWDIVRKCIFIVTGSDDLLYYFPDGVSVLAFSAVVYILSFAAAYIYNCFYKVVDNRFHIRDQMYNLIEKLIKGIIGCSKT